MVTGTLGQNGRVLGRSYFGVVTAQSPFGHRMVTEEILRWDMTFGHLT
jgi:hypothetical protein